MQFTKTVLGSLEKGYAASAFLVRGVQELLFASEVQAPCVAFNAETGAMRTVWDGLGGTMSMVPFPGEDGAFLAVHSFFPPFLAEGCGLLRVTPNADGTFTKTPFLSLPYLHRFALVEEKGSDTLWLLLSVLCREKHGKDDWSSPGYVAVARVNKAHTGLAEAPRILLDGQFHNHGLFKGTQGGKTMICTASDAGVFAFAPPQNGCDWQVRQLLAVPTGEAVLADLDGDGAEELVTIAPFHGSALRIYKEQNGAWQQVWQAPKAMEFAHSLWAGTLNGEACGLCGSRRGEAALFRFYWENGAWHTQTIDPDAGSSNLCVTKIGGHDCIVSANHSHNECAVYRAWE